MRHLLLASLFALLSCTVTPTPAPPPVPDGEPTCATACKRMQDLSCPEGGSTPDGSSCLNVCWDAEANGLPQPLRCLTEAASCDAAGRCE
jgi:hypothetical protein